MYPVNPKKNVTKIIWELNLMKPLKELKKINQMKETNLSFSIQSLQPISELK